MLRVRGREEHANSGAIKHRLRVLLVTEAPRERNNGARITCGSERGACHLDTTMCQKQGCEHATRTPTPAPTHRP